MRKSTIPDAGEGVFAEQFIPKRTQFGPYEGEITDNHEEAHETGYAWQVVLLYFDKCDILFTTL